MDREGKPLISVVVPVYNVEAYLERCLDSLAGQSYGNIQVILVDDASPDGSGALCDRYARRDGRFQAVHLPRNGGVSHARNEGIRRAEGEYITFVDPDDYVERDMLERMYANLMETGASMCVCGVAREGFGRYASPVPSGPACVLTGGEAWSCMLLGRPFSWGICGKICAADVVKGQRFDEQIHCGEDLLYLYWLLPDLERVSYMPDQLYHYLCRTDSATQGAFNPRQCTEITVYERLCGDAAIRCPELVPHFSHKILNISTRLAVKIVESGDIRGRELRGYLEKFHQNIRRYYSREAMAEFSHKKIALEVRLLYWNAGLFGAVTALYKRIKGFLS